MATLYLIEQNTILRKRGQRLLLCHRPPASRRYSAVLEKDIILDLPCADVDHVMLFGNIQVTTSALHSLLGNGIELAIFSFQGDLLGQLTPPASKNIPLRIEQFRCYEDTGFVLDFSKQIITAKIAHARTMLQRYRDNHPGVYSGEELIKLEEMQAAVSTVQNLTELLGYEGAAAAHYFSLFGRMLRPPWQFSGRNRRPPKDPVNAVLSFGYVVVGAQIQSLLDGAGLDPYLGFYHQPDYGRPGLALDLLEEFRHPLVDRLAIRLFNQGILQESHFYRPASGGVFLNTEGKRRFFQHYQKMLAEFSTENAPASPGGFMSVFRQQVHRLMQAIQTKTAYQPFQFNG